jgi:RimJ/RimL family protein N-acetyltransferase
MRIERTNDTDLARRIMTHPRIYPWVTEDGSPAPENFKLDGLSNHPGIYFLTPLSEDGKVAGVFMVHRNTVSIFECHTCILPEFWGQSLEAAKLMFRWVFDNTPCQKLVTLVPVNNRLALRLAKRAGMEEEGCIRESYMKNGVLIDQIILGVGRGQVCL